VTKKNGRDSLAAFFPQNRKGKIEKNIKLCNAWLKDIKENPGEYFNIARVVYTNE